MRRDDMEFLLSCEPYQNLCAELRAREDIEIALLLQQGRPVEKTDDYLRGLIGGIRLGREYVQRTYMGLIERIEDEARTADGGMHDDE